MNRLVNKLLAKQVSAWQLAGFVLANLCGMGILMTAVQFAADVKPLFTAADGFMQPGNIVVTKHVSTLGTLTGAAPSFSQREVERLKQQPFVNRMGAFTPAMFSVFATIGSQSMGMEFSTEMFFEAVPDQFLDDVLDRHNAVRSAIAVGHHGHVYLFAGKHWQELIQLRALMNKQRVIQQAAQFRGLSGAQIFLHIPADLKNPDDMVDASLIDRKTAVRLCLDFVQDLLSVVLHIQRRNIHARSQDDLHRQIAEL